MTHCETILAHLKAGKTICDDEARDLYNSSRLDARIHELRLLGYDIGSTEEPNVGKPGTHARYYLRSHKRYEGMTNGRVPPRNDRQADLFGDEVPA